MIVNEEQRRAMEFIATVNRGGYRPTGREINEWRLRPDAKPGGRGKLLREGVPEVPERRIRKSGPNAALTSLMGGALNYKASILSDALKAQKSILGEGFYKQFNASTSAALAGINSSLFNAIDATRMADSIFGYEYEIIPGKPGRAAEYGPDRPPEKFLAHLRRLGWIERNNRRRYSVTLLGQALLFADVEGAEYEDTSVIVLSKDDELAYAQVLGAIGGCGNALVVDAYLSTEALIHILTHTNATRFLVNHKFSPNKIAELSVLVGTAPPNDDGVVREIRRAEFHDRYLIGDDKTYSLTASLNGVGKSTALLFEMTDTAALAIRAEVEEVWQGADVLARGLEPSAPEVDSPDQARQITRDEDGKFRHPGCDIGHRAERTAHNCTKGT